MFPHIFSAAYTDQLELHEHAASLEQPTARWKRGYQEDRINCPLGYYLEPAPRSPPSSSSVATPPDGATTAPVSLTGLTAADSSKVASHGLNVYIHTLQVFPPRLPLPSLSLPRMAAKTHFWVSLWFALTIPVIFWDSMFLFMRPRSMEGGDLHWIWKPYALYEKVDYNYGPKAYEEGAGFPPAQGFVNIVENLMNIGYLYLAHVRGAPAAPLLGFASATITLSKTALYMLIEYYCGWCSIGHNDWQTLVILFMIPNGLWLAFPPYIMWTLGRDIVDALRLANGATAARKKQ